jgi:hypothetical protein
MDLHWDISDSVLMRTGEIALAPFQLGYLVLFTVKAHATRWLRVAMRRVPES